MSTLQNEAGWDRAIRVVAGLVILFVGWSGMIHGGWGVAFRIFGFVPLITGIIGWCPLYSLLGISTCPSVPRGRPPTATPVA